MATTTNTTTNNSWGEVKTKLFYGDKEIVNATKRVQPAENAHQLKYVTREGVTKLFYYADEVVILDTAGVREKQRAERDLFRQYMRHELTPDQFNQAIADLNA
jgi:hypothetical protein